MRNQESKWDILFAGFLPWVQNQPVGKDYDYSSATRCALSQYLHVVTGQRALVGGWSACLYEKDGWGDDVRIPGDIHAAISTDPYTFGALARRLEKQLAIA